MPSPQKNVSRRNQLIGAKGEALAAKFLIKEGYCILEQNYRTSLGEIDIIACEGEVLVFVEVKTRSSTRFGPPQSAVDYRKQTKMTQLALSYLSHKKVPPCLCRFDIVAILKNWKRPGNEQGFKIELIRNAFEMAE